MKNLVSLDRLPVLAMLGLILLGWAGASYYVPRMEVAEQTPFTVVWARYDAARTLQLVSWCAVGLVAALILPMGRSVPLREVGGRMSDLVNRFGAMWVGLAGFGLVFLIAVKGPYLFYAPEYLAFIVPSAVVSVANLLTPIAAVAAGVSSRRYPVFGYTVIVAEAVVLFGYATRMFAGLAMLFLVGRLLGGARVRWPAVLVAVAYTLLALPIPLVNRMNATHGLIPYASTTWDLIVGGTFVDGSLKVGAENVGFSAPLMTFVADGPRIPTENLFISVNPLPASVAGWGEIADSMRVHYYIPNSMIGELANVGGPVLAFGLFVWAVIARLGLQCVFRQSDPLMPFFVTAVLGLSFISTTYVVQYNTRSVARLMWIVVGIVIVESLFRRFWETRQWLLTVPVDEPPVERRAAVRS